MLPYVFLSHIAICSGLLCKFIFKIRKSHFPFLAYSWFLQSNTHTLMHPMYIYTPLPYQPQKKYVFISPVYDNFLLLKFPPYFLPPIFDIKNY